MNETAIEALRQRLFDRVRTDEEAIAAHLHDQWVLSVLRAMEKRAPRPACVVRPWTTEEVAIVLEIADRERVPVVPFGAGSGVCGGAVGPEGAIVVSLRSMDRVLELEERSMTVRTQPGVLGGDLEEWLQQRGYTMGHFPQSIAISSVGGWVSTRASGQLSTKYGNIEDMLLAFEAVLPGGRIVRTRPVPRTATGPDLRAFFLGSEGTLGIVTEATFRVHPAPESTLRRTYSFADFHSGLETIRAVTRGGWRPAVVRLYDGVEAGRSFAGIAPDGHSLLLVHCEGANALVSAEAQAVAAGARANGGEDRGTEAVERWFEQRNHVPSFESFLERGLVVDTLEVAAGWDRIHELYDDVISALESVEGMLVASGHSSHSYTQGTNIYFTFAARPASMADAETLYFRCRDAALGATLGAGGTISHHHGVGRQRAAWMRRELGTAYELLIALKHTVDPHGIMNPGALYGD